MSKSILITGATGNLGQAVVKKFYFAGFHIIGIDRERAIMGGYEVYPANLNDEARVEELIQAIFEEPYPPQAAILLVGGYAPGDLLATDTGSMQKMIQLNFDTANNVVQALLPHFEAQGGGHFVFIGSKAVLEPSAALYNVAYALSKSLLFQLAEIINVYGKGKNIRASVVVPSTIDTPPNRTAMPDADFSKWTTAEAIADNIHFLFTDSGQHLRGTVLKVYNEG
jgi:NAD(P)-dependent dehydrogenase (short-subunit alcohol dehydrogenase family)